MERLTNSRCGSYQKCQLQHWFSYEIGLRRIVDPQPLRMGSAGHFGLETLRKTDDVDAACHAVYEYYDSLNLPPIDGIDYEMATVSTLVGGYALRWWGGGIGIVETELEFNLPLVNPETGSKSRLFQLAGKIDGIDRLEDGRIAVTEHKFLNDDISQDSFLWQQLQLNPQITIYTLAARMMGYDVDCVLYDVIRKPTIKPTDVPLRDENDCKVVVDKSGSRVFKKDGSPRESASTKEGFALKTRPMEVMEWVEKLNADIIARQEFYYCRQEIVRLEMDLEEGSFHLWRLAKAIRECQKSGAWLRTCAFNTCKFCGYFNLCRTGWKPEQGVPEGFYISDTKHPELSG